MPPTDHDTKERLERAQVCLEALCPPSERAHRAELTSAAIREMVEYRDFLAAVDATEPACDALRNRLADRAFAAEASFRVALAQGLESVNDLRDSGMLHATLSDFARSLEGGDEDRARILRDAREELRGGSLALPDDLSDEIVATVSGRLRGFDYNPEEDTLVVRHSSPIGSAVEEVHVRLSAQPGDMGRIGVAQFFGAEGPVGIHGAVMVSPPSDCHERVAADAGEHPTTFDPYAGCVGGMASAREAMYRHARKVSQYGHGNALRVNDPGTIALVALAVAFVSFVVGGSTGGTTSVIAFSIFAVALGAAIIIAILFF